MDSPQRVMACHPCALLRLLDSLADGAEAASVVVAGRRALRPCQWLGLWGVALAGSVGMLCSPTAGSRLAQGLLQTTAALHCLNHFHCLNIHQRLELSLLESLSLSDSPPMAGGAGRRVGEEGPGPLRRCRHWSSSLSLSLEAVALALVAVGGWVGGHVSCPANWLPTTSLCSGPPRRAALPGPCQRLATLILPTALPTATTNG